MSMEDIFDAKVLCYDEFELANIKKNVDNDSVFDNNNIKNADELLKIIEKNDNAKLIEIQANDYLNKIKNIIGKPLDKKDHVKVDKDFIQSLKSIIILKNDQISNNYLEYLSYIYYALCNNTMDIYNKLKQQNAQIEYYMLDENYYNIIGYNNIDWESYQKKNRRTLLREAYKNSLLDELLEILNINDDFYLHTHISESHLMENIFRKMINTFDIKMLAQSDLYIFNLAIKNEDQEMINYLKNLYAINPTIDFSAMMFKKYELITMLKDNFELEQVAPLTIEQQYSLYSLEEMITPKKLLTVIKYFFDMIKVNPNLSLSYEGRHCIDFIVGKELPIVPELLAQMDKEEQYELYETLRLHNYNGGNVKSSLKLNKLIRELYSKYLEKEQYKVIKKEYKQNKNKRKI